jgi:hypothetical protein
MLGILCSYKRTKAVVAVAIRHVAASKSKSRKAHEQEDEENGELHLDGRVSLDVKGREIVKFELLNEHLLRM